jgi:hypothetical protein
MRENMRYLSSEFLYILSILSVSPTLNFWGPAQPSFLLWSGYLSMEVHTDFPSGHLLRSQAACDPWPPQEASGWRCCSPIPFYPDLSSALTMWDKAWAWEDTLLLSTWPMWQVTTGFFSLHGHRTTVPNLKYENEGWVSSYHHLP